MSKRTLSQIGLLLLLLAGDVESNPGPTRPREPKPDKAKIMADKVDAHEAKLAEMSALIESQAETIAALKVELTERMDARQVEEDARLEAVKVEWQERLRAAEVSAAEAAAEVKVGLERHIEAVKVCQFAKQRFYFRN